MLADLHPAISAWLEAEKAVEDARAKADEARTVAHSIPLPCNLRPAVLGDIVQGAVVWYPAAGNRPFHVWALVKSIVTVGGEFKGFMSHHGMRLGLDGAFVEVKGTH